MRVSTGLLAVVVIALVVRIGVVLGTSGFFPVNDAWDFDRNAVSLAEHGTFPRSIFAPRGATAYRPPAFPIALAGVYKLAGAGNLHTRWDAGRGLEAVLGALAVGLLYLIALELFDPAVALLAGLIGAVYPPFLLAGSSLLSESLFIPLVLLSVLVALRSRRAARPLAWAAVAGGLVALGALTRGNGIFLAVPVGLMVWTGRPRLGWPALRAPLTMLAGLIVVLIPWTVRNASALHSFVPLTTETGYTLAGAFNPQAATRKDFPYLWTPPASEITAAVKQEPEGNEAQISDRLQSSTLHYMGRHPGQVIKTLGWNVLRLFSLTGPHLERWGAPYQSYPRGLAVTSVYTFWLLAVLAIAGLFLAGAGDVPWSLWGCPLAILLGTLPIAATERMRIPADPFFILLAAGALAAVWRRGRIGSRPWNSSPTASGSSAASPGMPSTSTSSRTS